MVVDLKLFMKDLHGSPVAIGDITSTAGLVGAAGKYLFAHKIVAIVPRLVFVIV